MTAVNVTASRATPSIGSSVSSAIAAQGRSGRPPVTRFGPAHSCAMRLASGFHGRSERTGCPRVSEPGERRREPTSRARRVRRTPSRLPLAVRVLITRRETARLVSAPSQKTSEPLTHIAPSRCLSVARALSEARWARGDDGVRLRVPRLGSIREGRRRDVRASPSRDRSHRARVRASAGHVRGRPLCRHSAHANISIPPRRAC